MIEKCFYKDRPAIKIKGEKLTLVALPEDGGKVASITDTKTGREFLCQTVGEKYKRLAYDGEYIESECSSWDDMFPTIDPFTPDKGRYKGVEYPDHGEICRLVPDTTEKDGKVIFTFRSKLFDVDYVKTISVADDGNIDVHYSIKNNADEPFPYLWAGHCMLAGDDTARVITSYSADDKMEMAFGPEGKCLCELPVDRLMGYKPKTGYAYKYYYTEPMKKGEFGISYGNGQKLMFTTDEKIIKYIGVWINNGEFKDKYNIALECCTAPFDAPDKAVKKGYKAELAASEKIEFTIRISLE